MKRNELPARHFQRVFQSTPDRIVRAPGRVNLIGEHTDYNDGFVLPMAIDYDVRIAARRRDDGLVRLYSIDFDRYDEFDLGGMEHAAGQSSWSNYVRGVADVLRREEFPIAGMEAAITGNVPIGAGLSSSAAIETAAMTAFVLLNRLDLDPVRAALLCQRAENEFVGMRCGIMDQFIAMLGRAGHALLIDCRTLEYEPVPLPHAARVVVTDSGVRRGLVDSEYNLRRAQCEEGAQRMGVRALRDVSVEMFEDRKSSLSGIVARRCRHVVTEDDRTLKGIEALNAGDLETFGALMNRSHASMRDLFEITTPEIDFLVEIQQRIEGCYGARMTGGGFGGCTVALVREESVPALLEAVRTVYSARTGKQPVPYLCRASEGAGAVAP